MDARTTRAVGWPPSLVDVYARPDANLEGVACDNPHCALKLLQQNNSNLASLNGTISC